MKNYWLNRKPAGFPQDDEYSLQQICGDSANLDIFYAQHFQIEKLEPYTLWEAASKMSYGPTCRTPICNLTCTGSIYAEGILAATFTPKGERYVHENIYWNIKSIEVDNEMGMVFVVWEHMPKDSHIIMSYEASTEFDC